MSATGKLFGAVFGVSSGVALVAAGSSQICRRELPPFSLEGERFNQSTFGGRFAKMVCNTDATTLLSTEAEINNAVDILAKFKAGTSTATNAELWEARKLKESAVHPDTEECIPRPFRMAGYVPFNGPVCVAMIMSSSTPTLLFWNWVNQSQNAMVNYFNRNASAPTSTETIVTSYAGAVGMALSVAFGLSQVIQRRYSPAQAQRLLKFVAFPTSVVASCGNCYIVRRPECSVGTSVMDSDGNVLADGARSKIASTKAVHETVFSRGILQVPVFLVPAVLMSLPPLSTLTAGPGLACSCFLTISSFGFGLPAAIACFPQISSIRTSDLEPEFQGLKDKKGKPIDTVYFNKGL